MTVKKIMKDTKMLGIIYLFANNIVLFTSNRSNNGNNAEYFEIQFGIFIKYFCDQVLR